MSKPHDFEGSTHHFGPPPGQEDRVGWLHLFSNGSCHVSAWKPSPEELERLNNGESIFVSVWSGSRTLQREFPGGRTETITSPIVYPIFVGTENEVKRVVSDVGATW